MNLPPKAWKRTRAPAARWASSSSLPTGIQKARSCLSLENRQTADPPPPEENATLSAYGSFSNGDLRMTYPPALIPTAVERIALPSGQQRVIPKALPRLRRWTGVPPHDTYNGKPIVDIDGRPGFAELAILFLLQRSGWTGAWVDTYRNRRLTGFCDGLHPVELPLKHAALIGRLPEKGCFDLFCWRADGLLFAECKRRHHDRIRDT
jgi:hypothetical protein